MKGGRAKRERSKSNNCGEWTNFPWDSLLIPFRKVSFWNDPNPSPNGNGEILMHSSLSYLVILVHCVLKITKNVSFLNLTYLRYFIRGIRVQNTNQDFLIFSWIIVARFARNVVKWDFFSYFQTLWYIQSSYFTVPFWWWSFLCLTDETWTTNRNFPSDRRPSPVDQQHCQLLLLLKLLLPEPLIWRWKDYWHGYE